MTNCIICTGDMSFEEMRKEQEEFIEEFGWYSHIVDDDPSSPTGFNYHTHGFQQSLNFCDIQIVFFISGNDCQAIAHNIFNKIKERKLFRSDIVIDGIIENFQVILIPAIESNRSVLRVIIPDPEGNLLLRDLSGLYAKQWEKLT